MLWQILVTTKDVFCHDRHVFIGHEMMATPTGIAAYLYAHLMVTGCCCVCRYEDGQVGSDLVDMTVDKYQKMVENALASCFMAVVPDRDKSTENPMEKEDSTPSSTR